MNKEISNEVKLSKGDLLKSFFSWHMFAQSCYNYERLQGLGFCHAMIPALKKLYTTKEQLSQALKRHLQFFNTEANVGAFIPGMVIAMEEEKANGSEINEETINSLKTGLMGPFAGVGDTVTQGLVKTILIAIGVDMAAKGNAFGPILFFLLFTAYTLGTGYFMFYQGYKLGKNALSKFMGTDIMQKITDSMNILGLTVLGALVASRVNVRTPLIISFQQTTIEVQKLFDQIMPGMLGLILLFAILHFLKKGKSIVSVLLSLTVIGVVGAFFKIL